MLMTRLLYLALTVFLVGLNAAALVALSADAHDVSRIVPVALVVNAFTWPLALIVTYRIGQVTGLELLRKMRARAAARASKLTL